MLGEMMAEEQRKALELHQFLPPVGSKRVWLSRAGAQVAGRRKSHAQNEAEVEHILREAGWLIIRPEEFALPELLALLADAGTIAGTEGSAFHVLLLAREVKARILVVPRAAKGRIAPNLVNMAVYKQLDQRIITDDVEMLRNDGRGSMISRFRSPASLAGKLIAASYPAG